MHQNGLTLSNPFFNKIHKLITLIKLIFRIYCKSKNIPHDYSYIPLYSKNQKNLWNVTIAHIIPFDFNISIIAS